jgi:molybdopterin-guanine dinucleotide biosynthesis protein A
MQSQFKPDLITTVILSGGRGLRMAGLDKGLQAFKGQALVQHAIDRLQNQTAAIIINANRNLNDYLKLGLPVYTDSDNSFAGPLAGILAGLDHCNTGFLACVPCDCPCFPLDLVKRLWLGLTTQNASIAVACNHHTTPAGEKILMRQPVFCLMKTTLHDNLRAFIKNGGRKVDDWLSQLDACAMVAFDQADDHPMAFLNINSLEELNQAGQSS